MNMHLMNKGVIASLKRCPFDEFGLKLQHLSDVKRQHLSDVCNSLHQKREPDQRDVKLTSDVIEKLKLTNIKHTCLQTKGANNKIAFRSLFVSHILVFRLYPLCPFRFCSFLKKLLKKLPKDIFSFHILYQVYEQHKENTAFANKSIIMDLMNLMLSVSLKRQSVSSNVTGGIFQC